MQRIRKWVLQIPRWVQALLIALFFVLVAIWADLNFNWTGYGFVNVPLNQGQIVDRHRTIWDWMDLLIIPAVLAMGAIYINREERKNESKVAKERAEDAALETYLKQMSELLIDHRLRETGETDEKRTVARAWTLTIARRLSGERKGTLLQFLYEAGLISGDHPVISLRKADLREADLPSAALREANLREANLGAADLGSADLRGANLSGANLRGADLRGANLVAADLREAFLGGANLSRANMRSANIGEADLGGEAHFSTRSFKQAPSDLGGANLFGANLIEASLWRACLLAVDLREADLFGADLSEAHFSESKMGGARYDKNTKWPTDDFDPATHLAILVEVDG